MQQTSRVLHNREAINAQRPIHDRAASRSRPYENTHLPGAKANQLLGTYASGNTGHAISGLMRDAAGPLDPIPTSRSQPEAAGTLGRDVRHSRLHADLRRPISFPTLTSSGVGSRNEKMAWVVPRRGLHPWSAPRSSPSTSIFANARTSLSS